MDFLCREVWQLYLPITREDVGVDVRVWKPSSVWLRAHDSLTSQALLGKSWGHTPPAAAQGKSPPPLWNANVFACTLARTHVCACHSVGLGVNADFACVSPRAHTRHACVCVRTPTSPPPSLQLILKAPKSTGTRARRQSNTITSESPATLCSLSP